MSQSDPIAQARSVLAANIAQLRKARGLTQEQLGQLAGVPQKTISELEKEKNQDPGLRVLVRVAHGLGTTLSALFQSDTDATHATPQLPRLPDMPPEFLTRDPATREMVDRLRATATSRVPVVITGETGTGKSLLAQLIWRYGRPEGPFIVANIAGITRDLLDPELFGSVGGAFTGVGERQGLLEAADRGVLFLDEVADLTLEAQSRLLVFLDEGYLNRLGSPKRIQVDVKVVAATNADLAEAVKTRRVRVDLLHRLCGIVVRLPALRERPADVRYLVQLFLREDVRLLDDAAAFLAEQPWHGNVRELRQVIQVLNASVPRGAVLNRSDIEQVLGTMRAVTPWSE